MWSNTRLSKILGIKYPIIQAPMAGGATTPELVASISNNGGLGSLGAVVKLIGYCKRGMKRDDAPENSNALPDPESSDLVAAGLLADNSSLRRATSCDLVAGNNRYADMEAGLLAADSSSTSGSGWQFGSRV